jgi:hypothetical protein
MPLSAKAISKRIATSRRIIKSKQHWQSEFLDAYAACGRVYEAAAKAGTNPGRVTKARHDNDVVVWRGEEYKFQDAFEEAQEEARLEALASMEKEARRRAVHGTSHPVIYQGEITDYYKEKSDSLLMFLMKKHDPSYRERQDQKAGDSAGEQAIKVVFESAKPNG